MNSKKSETYSAAPGVKGPIVLVEDHGWMQTDQITKEAAPVEATRPGIQKPRSKPTPTPR